MSDDFNHIKPEAIRRGDDAAFERLFKAYYEKLSRFAWRYVKSKSIAEETVQEVFANIWDQREKWNPSGSVRSYLYSAVKNQAIDHIRHQRVRETYDGEWLTEQKTTQPTLGEPDQRDKTHQAIKKEIDALPERCRMAFKLSRYDGLTYREIAEVMDISVKTVESQMGRALKKLRESLSHLTAIGLLVIIFLVFV